jgi:hypothetical protein
MQVGGVKTKGLSLYEASDLLQGEEGSEVGQCRLVGCLVACPVACRLGTG